MGTCQSKRNNIFHKHLADSHNPTSARVRIEYKRLFGQNEYSPITFYSEHSEMELKKIFLSWHKIAYAKNTRNTPKFSVKSPMFPFKESTRASSVSNSSCLMDNKEARIARKSRQRDSSVSRQDTFVFSPEPRNKNEVVPPESSLRQFFAYKPKVFLDKLNKGPPESFRVLAWEIVTHVPEAKLEDVLMLALLQDLDPEIEIQIKKDLERSMGAFKQFDTPANRITLFNLLKALAINDPTLGYCQGTNIIVAFILLVTGGNELETFYLSCAMFSTSFTPKIGLRGFFTDQFPKLTFYVELTIDCVKHCLPKLHSHLESLEVPLEAVFRKWYQTLFLLCFPISAAVRVWDNIFSQGIDFLPKIGLTLIELFSEDILKSKDGFDLVESLTSLSKFTELSIETVLLKANKTKIPANLVENVEKRLESKFMCPKNAWDAAYSVFSLSLTELEQKFEQLDTVTSEPNEPEMSVLPSIELPKIKKINSLITNQGKFQVLSKEKGARAKFRSLKIPKRAIERLKNDDEQSNDEFSGRSSINKKVKAYNFSTFLGKNRK